MELVSVAAVAENGVIGNDGEHTYRFRLYAVDAELGLSPAATRDDVADAVTGHVLEKDTLEGTYAP